MRILALFLMMVSFATAQSFPSLTGRVVDSASMLSVSAKANIESQLKAYEAKSSDQVVIATVKSLEGYEISDYANRLFRAWKIGQAKQNNGVLLLIAKDDRKVRIEVGYGLEGTLTDTLSGLIIRENIVPKFKAGDVDGGMSQAVASIIKVLAGDASEMQARAAAHAKTVQQNSNQGDSLIPFVIIIVIFLIFFLNARQNQQSRMGNSNMRNRNPGWIIVPSGSSSWGGGGGSDSGGFSGGGGDSGGGGASGGW
jgi:uncharacterized protein